MLPLWLAASTPFSALFFLIPFELYYTAQQYWDWNKSLPLSFAAIGSVVYVAVCGLLFLLDRRAPRATVVIAHGLCALGTFVLLADVFAPVQTGPMDGSRLVSTEPLLLTVIELSIPIALVILFLRLSQRVRVVAFAATGLLVAVLSAGYLALVVSAARPQQARATATSTGLVGNVYHIVLDAGQTDAALAALAVSGRSDAFTGFTVFANNFSNYPYTHASFPSYMSGSFYESGSFERWTEDVFKSRGLLKALHRKGYAITMYGFLRTWDNPLVTTFRLLGDVFSDSAPVVSRGMADFVQIWLARAMPNVLTNEALAIGRRLGSAVQRVRAGAALDHLPMLYEEGRDTYASMLMMKEALVTEPARPSDGQYVYLHAVVPHPPYVLDSQCTYNLALRDTRDGYFQQFECVLQLVTSFLNQLRVLGRYDDATIVIHSDHGEGEGFLSTDGDRAWKIRPARVGDVLPFRVDLPESLIDRNVDGLLSRSMALLMIKPAKSTGPMQVSKRVSQLVDLYPTLAALLSLDVPERSVGENVFSVDDRSTLTPTIFWFPQFDRQPDVAQLRVLEPANIRESPIVFDRIVNAVAATKLPKAFQVGIATRDVDADSVRLLGFSSVEGSSDGMWRWSLGPSSEVVLRGLRVDRDTRVLLAFEARPLTAEVGNELTVSTARSSATVHLVQGFSRYRVELTLAGDEEPTFKIRYGSHGSPRDLGLGSDSRQLAVAWRRMDLAIVE